MIKIECCGLTATQTKQIIDKNFPGQVETFADPDMIAARKVKSGEIDFYLGSCMTGGGGSLATAIMVLGYGNCLVVSKQGNCPNAKQIRHMIYAGKHKAFGYVKSHTEQVIVPLVQALVDKSEGKPE
ncbi:MAG: DUF2620 family protein [Erysipelotrichaceae bacterium]|jgi:hypothetical protein|nr:DUF2620 family protein [Erysipelotrichaceae bacterium]MBQ4251597.1 DUF2620 family protein [Erysipelotrichaceae bacterium]MBQ7223759.1 DUF2620 family protein [Erysipelotrichaceae bacterium]